MQSRGLFLIFLFFLSGCGKLPLVRVKKHLFSSPLMTQTKKSGSVALGLKLLSDPEVSEFFCKSWSLKKSYHVLYVRSYNAARFSQTVTVSGVDVAQQEDVRDFFQPTNTATSVLMGVVSGCIGVGTTLLGFHEGASMFLSFAAGLGLGKLYVYLSGEEAYKQLAQKNIVYDKKAKGALVCLQPRHKADHFIFVRKSLIPPENIIFTCVQSNQKQGRVVEEITFSFEKIFGLSA